MKHSRFHTVFRLWRLDIQRKWNQDLNWWGDFSGYSGCDGGWEYRFVIRNRKVEV